MPRLINIADQKQRDAAVEAVGTRLKHEVQYRSRTSGKPVKSERLIKSTDEQSYTALLKKFGTPAEVSAALITSDPELDPQQAGRRLGRATKVYVDAAGGILYSARVLEVVVGPDGVERSRSDLAEVEATVGEELSPIKWSGRLLSFDEVVRRFVLVRQIQLRHVNGLTYGFLFDMAEALFTQKKMLLVGAGAKGNQPLIFQTNGAPFRGFLEGKVDGTAYQLILHLSNQELKVPVTKSTEAAV